MTERTTCVLTAEDLPFGVVPPVGMPASAAIVPEYDPIPHDLDYMEPGPFLAGFLSQIDVANVSGHDQIIVLRAHRRMASYYEAATYQDMAAVNTTMLSYDGYPQPDVEAGEMAAAEVRVALNLTRHAADVEIQFALGLHRRLPRLFDMLASGVVDVKRAKVIERSTMHLSDATAQAVVDSIADEAPGLTTGELRARLRAVCIQADPDEAQDRYTTAIADRRVVIEPTDVGTANLYAYDLPPAEAAAIGNRIHTAAKAMHGSPGETRSMDQLRTDVFLDYLNGINSGTGGNVDVTVTMETLTRLGDHPGDLAGFGPVIADVARQAAEQLEGAEWRFTVTDTATGRPVANGVTRRRPTTAQRRDIETRNPTCVFPGCRMPSIDGDIDHRRRWADGGTTSDDNPDPLCRHDHIIKDKLGWSYRPLTNGDYQWTSRLGHTYITSGMPP